MKTQTQFKNASLVSVVNGSIVVKDSTGREHTFTNASVVSINNGTIIIESKWKPERGELIKITGCCIDSYSILDKIEGDIMRTFGYKRIDSNINKLDNDFWCIGVYAKISPVTPEEQQAFDNFCKSKGKIWNKEKLQWEEYRWQPEIGDHYYHVDLELIDGVGRHLYENDSVDQCNYKHYNCFQTKEQAQKAAEKVKELLKSL